MDVPKRDINSGWVYCSSTLVVVGTKRQTYSWGSTFPTTSAPPLLNQTSPTNIWDSCSPTVLDSTSSPPRSNASILISGYFSVHFSAALEILEVLAYTITDPSFFAAASMAAQSCSGVSYLASWLAFSHSSLGVRGASV